MEEGQKHLLQIRVHIETVLEDVHPVSGPERLLERALVRLGRVRHLGENGGAHLGGEGCDLAVEPQIDLLVVPVGETGGSVHVARVALGHHDEVILDLFFLAKQVFNLLLVPRLFLATQRGKRHRAELRMQSSQHLRLANLADLHSPLGVAVRDVVRVPEPVQDDRLGNHRSSSKQFRVNISAHVQDVLAQHSHVSADVVHAARAGDHQILEFPHVVGLVVHQWCCCLQQRLRARLLQELVVGAFVRRLGESSIKDNRYFVRDGHFLLLHSVESIQKLLLVVGPFALEQLPRVRLGHHGHLGGIREQDFIQNLTEMRPHGLRLARVFCLLQVQLPRVQQVVIHILQHGR